MSIPDKEILRIARSDDWIMRKIWDRLTAEEEQRKQEQLEQEKKGVIDSLAQNLEKATILSVEVLDYGTEGNKPKLQIITNKGIILSQILNE